MAGSRGQDEKLTFLSGGFGPSRLVPVRTFTCRTELGLSLSLRRPFMITALTLPVPNDLFYLSHQVILPEIIYYVK